MPPGSRVLVESAELSWPCESYSSTNLRRFLASFRCTSGMSVRKYTNNYIIALADVRWDSRSVLKASTPFESRGLETTLRRASSRHREPQTTPRRASSKGRDSEEIDNPCLVEVLLIRAWPGPPAELRMRKGWSCLSARGAQSNK